MEIIVVLGALKKTNGEKKEWLPKTFIRCMEKELSRRLVSVAYRSGIYERQE